MTVDRPRPGDRAPSAWRRWAGAAIVQLTLTRIRETVREPGTMFWVFGFPILLSLGLGMAFRNRGPEPVFVGVLDGTGTAAVATAKIEGTLTAAGLHVERLAPGAAIERLRSGKIALLVVPTPTLAGALPAPGAPTAAAGAPRAPVTYRFDPTRPEARAARDAVNNALEAAAGRVDRLAVQDDPVTQPGTRYIDFLIPGLIGMNVMSGSMWGIGWVIVNMRVRKLLKRLMATPMRRRDMLLAQGLARLLSLPFEVGAIVIFARLAFDVTVNGGWVALSVVSVVGALSFAAIGGLVASRAETVQTVNGLMNVVMMPMFVVSGVFFSATHFPAIMQPFISILPLTALNDALRAIMIDGATLAGVARPLSILTGWGVVSFAAGLKIFRWG